MHVTVCKEFKFEAAHYLPGHLGACANVHGHSYKLQVEVKANPTKCENVVIGGGPSDGMVIDFSDLKRVVNDFIISKLDHKYLNEVLTFRPTAENMAMWMADLLLTNLQDYDLQLVAVRLWETDSSFAQVRFD